MRLKQMFQIEVERIFNIPDRGQIIYGKANAQTYTGTLRCGNEVFTVIGFPFQPDKDGYAAYLLDTFSLTDDYVGKVLVEEKRKAEKM
jgi:hypothetical protein